MVRYVRTGGERMSREKGGKGVREDIGSSEPKRTAVHLGRQHGEGRADRASLGRSPTPGHRNRMHGQKLMSSLFCALRDLIEKYSVVILERIARTLASR